MRELSEAELDTLIDEAIVDAHGEGEQLSGFAVMIGDNLAVPFETTVLGVTVTVEKVGETGRASSRSASAASTGRPSRSSIFRCRTWRREARNGSRPTAAGRDRRRA